MSRRLTRAKRYQANRKPAPTQFSVYSAVGSLESCQR
jgi:hypothetical protein